MNTLSMRIVTYLIKYLGKFEFIFKTILDYESGEKTGSFDTKNRHRKSHAWAPLKEALRFQAMLSLNTYVYFFAYHINK